MKTRIAAGVTAGVLALAAFAPRASVQAATPPTVHEVRMVMTGNSARYEPATLTINSGDQVRFVNVSGGPHNVAFDAATIPADVKPVLSAHMANQIDELWGPLMNTPGATYTVSFAGVRAGRYAYFCVPHMYDKNGNVTAGMKGTIIVR
ncbi:MAG TPA: plastocyanin/azurin family copper-binding protein [Longimicrobium sp.]|jgi:plastocyanin|nr:plastocyanin/azurin family copper-binding protein [Longimicrobium sp.]